MEAKVRIGICPFCGKDARIIESAREVPESLRGCDSNETYKCFRDKEFPESRYIKRHKHDNEIDWAEVDRIQR